MWAYSGHQWSSYGQNWQNGDIFVRSCSVLSFADLPLSLWPCVAHARVHSTHVLNGPCRTHRANDGPAEMDKNGRGRDGVTQKVPQRAPLDGCACQTGCSGQSDAENAHAELVTELHMGQNTPRRAKSGSARQKHRCAEANQSAHSKALIESNPLAPE